MSSDVFAPMVDDLWAQHTELEVMLVDCEPHEWHAATRCEAWDVADVVLHLAQTNALAIASATARLAWRTLPYAFARAGRGAQGPVAFLLTG
ncbi:MAG TPA: maleylpyruvate isomerase N-terminal domain-containing protein, partial [Acidimicrobiia bacterium]